MWKGEPESEAKLMGGTGRQNLVVERGGPAELENCGDGIARAPRQKAESEWGTPSPRNGNLGNWGK